MASKGSKTRVFGSTLFPPKEWVKESQRSVGARPREEDGSSGLPAVALQFSVVVAIQG